MDSVIKNNGMGRYILDSYSPENLKCDYNVALYSIRNDVNSANYVEWEKIDSDKVFNLIQEVINNGYVLSINSCSFLQKNVDVALNSLKIDPDSIYCMDYSLWSHPKMIKYLIQSGYKFNRQELRKMPLSALYDKDIMQYVLERYDVFYVCDDFKEVYDEYPMYIKEYKDRYIKLFLNALSSFPKIANYESRLQYIADVFWKENREDNLNDYANIFGKICAELNNNENYHDACHNLSFLINMENVLGDKYVLLESSMIEYHTMIHSGNKIDSIDNARNQIAKLSALYISISKEKYKKEIVDSFYKDLKLFYIPKKDNLIVQKKIIEHKQRKKLERLFQIGDDDLYCYLDSIVDKWKNKLDRNTIRLMIESFIADNCSKLSNIVNEPAGYRDYIRYKEALKLINRLNSKYIKYTDKELIRYLDIIKYDSKHDMYYYRGLQYDDDSINEYRKYSEKLLIFENIKKQIVFKMKEIKVNNNITRKDLNSIIEDIPFNDEYFEFDKEICNNLEIANFINACISDNICIVPEIIFDDEVYSFMNKFIINNNLIWLMLIVNSHKSNIVYYNDLSRESLFRIFNHTKEIIKAAQLFKYDMNSYDGVIKLNELIDCADSESLAILGEDIILKLCEERQYTGDDTREIIRIAKDLVCKMSMRNKSTVPYVSGRYGNYKYSMYDSQDETILLSGINTNACFRVDGNDNDFLHYCALDKNGFVIKIVDEFDNFIGRAAGFRNGNGIYINQLRTIYDYSEIGYEGYCESEKKEIMKTFRKACNDIIRISQNNQDEQDKIDFVLVTKSYALSDMESNVSRDMELMIGDTPMDNKSSDWTNFIKNTENLQEIFDEDDIFSTDYGKYSLICIAASNRIDIYDNARKVIKRKDVPALYKRKRNRVIIDDCNLDIIRKVNKIKGIYACLNKIEFKSVSYPQDVTVFVGDNWFIACNKDTIIDSCLLDFDKNAIIEYNAVASILGSNLNMNVQYVKKL